MRSGRGEGSLLQPFQRAFGVFWQRGVAQVGGDERRAHPDSQKDTRWILDLVRGELSTICSDGVGNAGRFLITCYLCM